MLMEIGKESSLSNVGKETIERSSEIKQELKFQADYQMDVMKN